MTAGISSLVSLDACLTGNFRCKVIGKYREPPKMEHGGDLYVLPVNCIQDRQMLGIVVADRGEHRIWDVVLLSLTVDKSKLL